MRHRMLAVLQDLRQDVARLLDRQAILDHCQSLGHPWRQRVLDPFATVHVFLAQVLHGNAALAHLPHLVGRTFTASAYCQARARLPVAVLQGLLTRVGSALRADTDHTGRWLGHRTLLVDGSSFSMPDTPELQACFGRSRKAAAGCGFPVAHLMALFHAGTGLLVEVFAAPFHSHDMGLVGRLHPRLEAGDVLVGDRGSCSFAHLARLAARRCHAVFRIHQRQIVDFTPGRPHADPRAAGPSARGLPRSRWVRAVGLTDQVVAWLKPAQPPDWMTAADFAALPESVTVRELRYRIEVPGFRTRSVTLVTTLLDAAVYTPEALAALYLRRWQVETHLRQLKQTMKLDVLKCETEAGVTKELTAYAVVYNLVRVVMLEAARRQRVEVDRISFIDALRWLAHARVGDPLPRLVVNPERPHRTEPRTIKRRPKQYPWMSAPRPVLRKRLIDKAHAA
jgi:hypothetical protein